MATKLRLIHDATKQAEAHVTRSRGVFVKSRPNEDEEFSKRILTANHGPTCAAFLVRKFKKTIKARGYFVVRLPASEDQPMWFLLAIRFFGDRPKRWAIHAFERPGWQLWKVSYKRHALFARERPTSHLRIV